MDKSSLTQSLTETIQQIAKEEAKWSAEVGTLSTLVSKDIPADEREKYNWSLNYMRQVNDELASIRKNLKSILKQVEEGKA